MRPVETILRRGKKIKENDELRYVVSTFVNVIMHPQHNNKVIKIKKICQ
jgi:hypothetical protein